MSDPVGAFVEVFERAGSGAGPLAGLTVAVKDIYDVAGRVTGAGNPDFRADRHPAEADAPAVAALLSAGATLVGKTHTDEIAYSLMGVNAHYGTPTNPRAPDRVPGGSSSGSAAAVAAGLADVGLGSDTGGSVRLPASFCGVLGLRTTHGRIPLEGVVPLAPSFDTVGWFARSLDALARTARAFSIATAGPAPARLLLPVDAWALADAAVVEALAPSLSGLEASFGAARPVRIAREALSAWKEVFRIAQAAEVWRAHGAWVEARRPAFGPGVRERFEMARRIGPEEARSAATTRRRLSEDLRARLGEDQVMVLPTAPGPAPLLSAGAEAFEVYRNAALQLLCAAGIAGLPQLTVPVATVEGAPVGLSLVGPLDGEGVLLAMAASIAG